MLICIGSFIKYVRRYFIPASRIFSGTASVMGWSCLAVMIISISDLRTMGKRSWEITLMMMIPYYEEYQPVCHSPPGWRDDCQAEEHDCIKELLSDEATNTCILHSFLCFGCIFYLLLDRLQHKHSAKHYQILRLHYYSLNNSHSLLISTEAGVCVRSLSCEGQSWHQSILQPI